VLARLLAISAFSINGTYGFHYERIAILNLLVESIGLLLFCEATPEGSSAEQVISFDLGFVVELPSEAATLGPSICYMRGLLIARLPILCNSTALYSLRIFQ
jgi:hypothetical protein